VGSRTVLSLATLALVVASACGDEDTNSARGASGGRAATGGATPAGGATPVGGAADGGLPSQGGAGDVAGMGGALALGGGAAAGGAAGSRADGASGADNGGVAGWEGSAAGTFGAGAIDGGGAMSGPSGTGGDAGAGGRSWPGQVDETWGGMDGLGGTRCWWPGVEEEDMGKITGAYDLPADIEACAQEQCESTECGPGGSWSSCSNCTRGHDECRCACRQLYLECGDCDAYSTCIGYCLVMHC
jgi:hypothetical protein